MAEQSPTGPHKNPSACEQQFHELLAAEAAKWAGHALDEDGFHNEDRCRVCLESQAVVNSCRCGKCCRLLIEVDLEDANREPKIQEKGSPIYTDARLTESGERELAGYLLNVPENGYACAFLDTGTNLCSIYPTRPLVCRLFDCDGAGREQLIELGIIDR